MMAYKQKYISKKKRFQQNFGNKSGGFTLIEIIVSIAILAILSVAILSSLSFNYSNVLYMGRKTDAVQNAQAFLEDIYANGVGNIITGTESESLGPYVPTQPDRYLFYKITSATVPSDPESLDIISVRVFYQNGAKYITLSSQIP